MIQIIAGKKGKGKTKYLLEKANASIKEAKGSIVYIDKNTNHMFELNRNVRLIDISQYPVHNYDSFVGFISGIISQDHDLQEIYLDSFLTLAYLTSDNMAAPIDQLAALSEKYEVNFILSVSEDKEFLPENAQNMTILAL